MFSNPFEASQNSLQSPKGFSVAVWKLRRICENMRKTDVLPEESSDLKVVLAFKFGERKKPGAIGQSAWYNFGGVENN